MDSTRPTDNLMIAHTDMSALCDHFSNVREMGEVWRTLEGESARRERQRECEWTGSIYWL